MFFPAAVLFKTPLPFFLLSSFGTISLLRRHRREWRPLVPLASALAMMLVAMSSRIDLGIRYVLLLYPMLAIVAGFGAARLFANPSLIVRSTAVALLIGQAGVSLAAHPDYLAYFNVLAGREPERLLVGSDLDWGQDVNRVVAELHLRGVERVAAALHGNADLPRHGFPFYTYLHPHQPTTGWIVISLTELMLGTSVPPFDGYHWLEPFKPVAMIGKTVRLYHIESLTVPVKQPDQGR